MKNYIVIEDAEGHEMQLPTEWAICGHCGGEGTQSLGGHAFGADEWAEWSQEDQDDYLGGTYDTPCPECNGRTTVKEVNVEALTPEQAMAYDAHCWQQYWDSVADAGERAMGC